MRDTSGAPRPTVYIETYGCQMNVADSELMYGKFIASGYDDDDLARRFLEAGACGYLAKPYRTVELGKMLRSVLGQ